MRAATGRDLDEVQVATTCLLSLFGPADPTPEQVAGAAILAFGLFDLHLTAERLKG